MDQDNHHIPQADLRAYERISRYLRGMMSEAEEAAFLQEVRTDEPLRSKALAMAYLAKALKHVGAERDAMVKEALLAADEQNVRYIAAMAVRQAAVKPEWANYTDMQGATDDDDVRYRLVTPEMEASMRLSQVRSQRRPVIIRRLAAFASIAAAVVIIAVVGWQYYDYRSTLSLASEYGPSFTTEQAATLRGSQDEVAAKELALLYANVQSGRDLDYTIRRLDYLWSVATQLTYNDYTNDAPLIGWNLAIAHLKDNDKASARLVLDKLLLITEPTSAIHQKAQELLKKL